MTERLRALLAEATSRPWGPARCRDAGNPTNDPSWTGLYGFLGWEIEPLEPPERGMVTSGWDAALIVAAVNALPALLDVVDAARNLSDRRTLDSDGYWVSQKEMRALDEALARLEDPQ